VIALLSAGALSLVFTLAFTPLFIRLFKKFGWGQFIRDDGPQSHHAKRGTATMGGIIIIIGALVSSRPATSAASVWAVGPRSPDR
jgi:phospho-N-acetylmuramoyl-pentapeptide-transferase